MGKVKRPRSNAHPANIAVLLQSNPARRMAVALNGRPRRGEALQPREHPLAQAAALRLRETAAGIERATHFHHGQFGDAAHPFMAQAEAPAEFTERQLPLRMKPVL